MIKHIFCFLLVLIPAICEGAQIYQAGFRTLGIWTEEPHLRVDVNVWYPSTRQPKELNYPPWILNVARNARPAEGRFPLLVLSHPTPTDRFAYHDLAAYLAREGFAVVAPTHGMDCMINMDDLFTWQQLTRRIGEIGTAIDLVLAEKDLARCLDASRIGVIGFGAGATAALLMGGALPTCASWPEYCAKAGNKDAYCTPWARDRINSLCDSFPLNKSLADRRVKAVCAIAPGYGMLFGQDSFRYFYPPLLLVCAGKDQFNRCGLHCEPLARILGSKTRFLELPMADAGALMAECPPALAAELPELCQSVTQQERLLIRYELQGALLAFFQHYLGVPGNLPQIPLPPGLESAQEGVKEGQSLTGPEQKRK